MSTSNIKRPKWPDDYEAIMDEAWRQYTFADGVVVRVEHPTHLYVTENGHRITDANLHGHYVPSGWVHLEWAVNDGVKNPAAF